MDCSVAEGEGTAGGRVFAAVSGLTHGVQQNSGVDIPVLGIQHWLVPVWSVKSRMRLGIPPTNRALNVVFLTRYCDDDSTGIRSSDRNAMETEYRLVRCSRSIRCTRKERFSRRSSRRLERWAVGSRLGRGLSRPHCRPDTRRSSQRGRNGRGRPPPVSGV